MSKKFHPNPIPPLLGASRSQLTDWVQTQSQPAYRGQQLHQWIYQKGVRSLEEITVFPQSWRAELKSIPIGRSQLHHRSPAQDGTVKYLLQLADGQIVETVGIPTQKRLTVCVSSQVGCPMACDFCATGKGNWQRNLACHEIVDQVLTVQEDFQRRVGNVVFMGMGEPLLNLDSVLAAIRSLNEDVGIGQRSLTLSTVGIPDRLRKLAKLKLQITLAVSLHASNQALRSQLVPSAQHYPLEALFADCREYVATTGRRVSFEYIVLAGVNDQPAHALELARHLRGLQSHVNLIPYNPIAEVDYQRPTANQLQTFMACLQAQHITATLRRSRGLDQDAACGQLRASQVQAAV
ncbi:MAG: 23S rRNA (adenine(2503)-C(2))-methyltransferase RlmN [Acaryochloridaceae cyanobacterium CSU_5_19]|nr:23S rRNA (adenine(2503)-C(2))-methyltransferase RlmN [Acaryochloridaceae cyanobacterium CSU_5_19]